MASEHEKIDPVLQGHLDRQEWGEAIVELIKLIRLVPQDLELHLRLAHLYWKIGNIDKAFEGFRHCAQGFYEGNRHKEALAAAISMLKLQPDSEFALEMVRNIKAEPDFVRKGVADSLKENFLASLPAEALEELASCLQLAVYPEGATIVEEGGGALQFFLIRRGEVEVFVTDRGGKRAKLAALREGDFLGEISLLRGDPRTATAVAAKRSELWVLGKPDFDRFVTKHRRFKEVLDQHSRERAKESVRRTNARGIERRAYPRVPVNLRAQAVMLDEGGNPLSTGPLTVVLEDISLGGARLRVPVPHPRQWAQLNKVRQVHMSPEPGMSFVCSLERARQEKLGRQSYADLGLAFQELSGPQEEQINRFITRQLAT